jgi:hypothetical protein
MTMPTYLPLIFKAISLFALLTGNLATLKGLDSLLTYFPPAKATTSTASPSSKLEHQRSLITSPESILADSQYRYFGATWASYGGLLWWIADDIEARKVPLSILAGFMVVGGVGRVISGVKYGFSHGAAKVATVAEFVMPGLLWVVLR